MTVGELKKILSDYPDSAIIMYRHNKSGRIDVNEAVYKEEKLLSGKMIKSLTLEGKYDKGDN